eukprot:s1571_g15.t1
MRWRRSCFATVQYKAMESRSLTWDIQVWKAEEVIRANKWLMHMKRLLADFAPGHGAMARPAGALPPLRRRPSSERCRTKEKAKPRSFSLPPVPSRGSVKAPTLPAAAVPAPIPPVPTPLQGWWP